MPRSPELIPPDGKLRAWRCASCGVSGEIPCCPRTSSYLLLNRVRKIHQKLSPLCPIASDSFQLSADEKGWVLDRTELARLQERVERLQAWVSDLQEGTWVNCVYCGHRYGPQDSAPVSQAEVLKAHILQCPEHPLSAMKKHLEAVVVPLMLWAFLDPPVPLKPTRSLLDAIKDAWRFMKGEPQG